MQRVLKSLLSFNLAVILAISLFSVSNSASDFEKLSITVDASKIINPDFAGMGVNIIPTNLMPASLAKGYNNSYWEMDKKRILSMKPKFTRVWFQIDWMESQKGVYTWDSQKMIAFCKYLEVLKDAGTEVELNFGWKVGKSVQSWFCIPGVKPEISAPADLDAYAASCSACLNQLINVKKFTNIKYLTFYNEPNGSWDFECTGDQKAYYASMVQKVHDKLTTDGIRSLVKILGPEETGDISWIKYMKDNIDSCMDGYTFHVYGTVYKETFKQFSDRINYVAPKPVYLTEFGWNLEGKTDFGASYANTLISAANNGISGLAMWELCGATLEDPHEGGSTNGGYTLYSTLQSGLTPRLPYYEVSMLERYLPAHSSVISAETISENLHTAAFKTINNDYTIVVECNQGIAKNLTIDFKGLNIGKTFQKHIYTHAVKKEDNCLIPAATESFVAGSSFTDTNIPSDYCVIVYTTIPSQTQVEVTPVDSYINAGATVQLSAIVKDNKDGVTWSIANGAGKVSSTGVYTSDASAAVGSVIAVKAFSNSHPSAYGIALIHIGQKPTLPTPYKPAQLPKGELLFSDDFSNDLSKWNQTTNFSITNGTLLGTNNEKMETIVGSDWTNFILETDVYITKTCAGIVFRKKDDNNFYMWQIGPGYDSYIKMAKKVNGTWSMVNTTYDFSFNKWYHIKIEANGSKIKTFVDGNYVNEYTDTQFSSGKVGIRQCWTNEAATFDNFSVCSIGTGTETKRVSVSGYVYSEAVLDPVVIPKVLSGIKVELNGTSFGTTCDGKGYFEIKNIPADIKSYTLKISMPSNLTREVKNIILDKDVVVSTKDLPLYMWAGDLNNDNSINMSDVMLLAISFNSSSGDKNYNEKYDINADNSINMFDVIICAKHFNQTTEDY